MKAVEEMLAKLFRPPRILLLGSGVEQLRGTVERDYECDVEAADEVGCCAPKLKLDRYDLILINMDCKDELGRAVMLVKTLAPDTPLLVVANSALAPIVNSVDTEVAFIKSMTNMNWDRLFRTLRIRVKTKAAPMEARHEGAAQMQIAVS
jgi:hypothetical protein